MRHLHSSLAGASEIHLWLTNPGVINDETLLERYRAMLSSEELASYRELAQADHRREYLISQAFLRDALGNYSNGAALEFERNASGKPSLKHQIEGQVLQFNLSHSAELMACAVTCAGPVGVDVEPLAVDSGMLEVADHYFSSSELASLSALDDSGQQQLFCKIWTLKEAYIKARGEGLDVALDSFSFECDAPDNIRLKEQDEYREDWQFWSLQPVPGQIIAIAAQTRNASLRVFSGVPLVDSNEICLATLGQVA
jgi:4'-phosphopantetheinyl transferase